MDEITYSVPAMHCDHCERAVSSELRDALIQAGVPASKIAAVPNGVDADLFTPVGEAYRNGFEGKCVVGFVGSLKAWHGLDLLAEAFRRLAADPRYHLLVVGQGPQAKLIESLREELPGRVTQVGAPWKLDGASSPVRVPPPLLGQHTEEVLRELLG